MFGGELINGLLLFEEFEDYLNFGLMSPSG
jgi:hypothetical protein